MYLREGDELPSGIIDCLYITHLSLSLVHVLTRMWLNTIEPDNSQQYITFYYFKYLLIAIFIEQNEETWNTWLDVVAGMDHVK